VLDPAGGEWQCDCTSRERVCSHVVAAVIAAFAFGRGNWSNFQGGASRAVGDARSPIGEALAIGLVSVFFSFAGFWEASRIAGDVREPSRTLPRALAIGVGCLTAIYALTTAAFIYLVPASQAGNAAEFARRAGELVLGPSGPSVFAAIVLLSVVPSAMALLMMAPRVYLAMSADGLFPAVLASVSPVTAAPIRATVVLASIASIFVLLGTFEQVMAFLMCATLGFIALAAAAQLVVRRRPAGRLVFEAPGSPYTTILFVLLIVGVVALVLGILLLTRRAYRPDLGDFAFSDRSFRLIWGLPSNWSRPRDNRDTGRVRRGWWTGEPKS
jgi:APA family basic amino acid/polyamine antiporter